MQYAFAMHEMSIALDLITLIEDIARQNDAATVRSAIVEIGALAGVQADALEFAFEIARKDTLAADCALSIVHCPLRASCPACGWEGELAPEQPICGGCGHLSLKVLAGRDMRLVSIDVD